MMTAPSVDDSSISAQHNTAYVWLISLVAAMGGLLFGWDWVVIGGAKPFFQRYFQISSEAMIGWANSCALIGCLIGALTAGGLSERFGRKKLLIASSLIFVVTSLGNAFAMDFSVFIAWRILGGVAIGLASNLSPMYIAEVAPASMRGRLVSVNQLTIVIGILMAQYINWFLVRKLPSNATDEFIRASWFGQQGWRWMFGVTAVPAILFFLFMFVVPESPRWLAKKGKTQQAFDVLTKVGGASYANKALAEIRTTLANETEVRYAELFSPKLLKVLLLGIFLAVFQQWCGINVIFNYAEEIFQSAGYDISMVLKNIAWTGSVNLFFTFFALGFVDRRGRRPLMLFGTAGLALIYVAIGCAYAFHITGLLMLLLVLAAIGCYAMSLAPITWVVISEIFPNRIRGAAMAVAVSALWMACFILTYVFPILNRWLGPAVTFWLFSVVCTVGFVFIFYKLPETRGKTLEQLEKELVDK